MKFKDAIEHQNILYGSELGASVVENIIRCLGPLVLNRAIVISILSTPACGAQFETDEIILYAGTLHLLWGHIQDLRSDLLVFFSFHKPSGGFLVAVW